MGYLCTCMHWANHIETKDNIKHCKWINATASNLNEYIDHNLMYVQVHTCLVKQATTKHNASAVKATTPNNWMDCSEVSFKTCDYRHERERNHGWKPVCTTKTDNTPNISKTLILMSSETHASWRCCSAVYARCWLTAVSSLTFVVGCLSVSTSPDFCPNQHTQHLPLHWQWAGNNIQLREA